MKIKTLLTFIVPLSFLITSCNKDEKPPVESAICTTTVDAISNAEFGDVSFKVSMSEFQNLGFDYMDLIDTTFDHVYIDNNGIHFDGTDEQSLTFARLPFVSNYNEVGYFAPCLCNYQKKNDWFEIAPGMHEIKNYAQELFDHRNEYTVTFKLAERGGYKETDDMVSCSSKISFEQADYNLDKFANVRDITRVGAIKDKIKPGLYIRGSSPFDPKSNDNDDGRNLYADFLLGQYGVTNEISLATKNKSTKEDETEIEYRPLTRMMIKLKAKDEEANTLKLFGLFDDDDENKMGEHEYLVDGGEELKSTDTFFSTSMGSDYFTRRKSAESKLEGGDITREVINYFAFVINENKDNDSTPIFYLHCNEGKDRTGWFSMLIEALCGVSFGDIVHDFMLTFTNYYHKFNRYDEESIKMYDAMKLQTIYRFVYALTCEDPIASLSTITEWSSFDVAGKLSKLGIIEDSINTGEIMRKYATQYLVKVLGFSDPDNPSNDNDTVIKDIYEYFSTSGTWTPVIK